MPQSILSVEEWSVRGLAAPCVCHGRGFGSERRKETRVAYLPTARVSSEAIRPLFRQALARIRERQDKAPAWNQREDLESVSLVRFDRWIEEVSARLREPALGLLALGDVQRGAGQVVELAAECAPTLADALLVLTRHIGLLNEAASFHLHVQGPKAVLVMGSRQLLSHVMRDYLAGWVALSVARWLGAKAELELWFAGSRPTYAFSYQSALRDVSVGFRAPCDALLIPAALLNAPLRLADPKLNDFLVRLARRIAVESLVERSRLGA